MAGGGSSVEVCKHYVQSHITALERELETGEEEIKLLRASPASLLLRPLLDCREAELDRLCCSLDQYCRVAQQLCGNELCEEDVARWMVELCDGERRSHKMCELDIEARRADRPSSERKDGKLPASEASEPAPHANNNTTINTKKRRRIESKQHPEKSEKQQQQQQPPRPKKQQKRPSAPLSPPVPLSAFQLPPLLHYRFPSDMIESLTGRPCPPTPSKHSKRSNRSSQHLSSPSSSPDVSSSSSSPTTSDVEEMADGGDGGSGGEDEEDEEEEETHPYAVPFLLPPIPSFSTPRRTTLTTLLTFTHPLPNSHYTIHCLPIPPGHLPPASWPSLPKQANQLLCEMNRDGGRGSSNGYYLLLASASSTLVVSASYLTLTEASGRYTLAVNCFCTRRELQQRGCGRVLYEAIRELRCRLAGWLAHSRPASSRSCQLIVHAHPSTEAMWVMTFGLRRLERARCGGGGVSGGYMNTVALVDGRRGMEDRRREWVERIVQWDAAPAKVQNGVSSEQQQHNSNGSAASGAK